jgi:iron-sulfur cluster assembly protein
MPILLSDMAASEIKKIIQEQELPNRTRLRVGVKGGGCSGITYVLDLVEEETSEDDEEFEDKGVKMLVDMRSFLYLDGTEIDFRNEVMGSGFVFKNPNPTTSCGCGASHAA